MGERAGGGRGESVPLRAPGPFGRWLLGLAPMLLLLAAAGTVRAQPAPLEGDDLEIELAPLYDWDLVSLEQNNPRFNGSMLTGFHSVRSPGVTPYRGWKTGVGVLYTHEEQVTEPGRTRMFDRDQLIVNPKLNYGFFPSFEAGLGVTGSWALGREVVRDEMGVTRDEREDNLDVGSVDFGVKWHFLEWQRLRLATSFDSRVAINPGDFGNLPGNFYNFELDGDWAVTPRFGMVGNLQLITSEGAEVDDQVIGDVGAAYTFTDQFRGMLFTTLQEDDEAGTVLGFVGIAGQHVIAEHSFTLAFDLQLNDAGRPDVRTEEQLDIELSYTFTFE